MRNTTTNALEVLESQHREVDELIERLEVGSGDRDDVFRELVDTLAAHAAVEEKLFYPAVVESQTEELVQESVEEHLAMRRTLGVMLALDPDVDEDEFDAKLAVLKEQVAHHAHEKQEGELFPILRRTMSSNELATLGAEVLGMFEELMEREPRLDMPDLDEGAPLR